MTNPIVPDAPVYQEDYYQDITLILADDAGCSTPELVYVAPITDWIDTGDSASGDWADFTPFPLD